MAAWPTAIPFSKRRNSPSPYLFRLRALLLICLAHQVPDDAPEKPSQNEADYKADDGFEGNLKGHSSAEKPPHGNHHRHEDAEGKSGTKDQNIPQTRLMTRRLVHV